MYAHIHSLGLVEVEEHSVVEYSGSLVEGVAEAKHVWRERRWRHDLAAVSKGEAVAALPRGKPGLGEHLLRRQGCARAGTTSHQDSNRGKGRGGGETNKVGDMFGMALMGASFNIVSTERQPNASDL